jgi:hypothetical protein
MIRNPIKGFFWNSSQSVTRPREEQSFLNKDLNERVKILRREVGNKITNFSKTSI